MRTGTSSIIVAAFVGPGTVLTCASAGVRFGYDLGWVLLFATGAAFVLQTITAGTGILVRQGLGEALRNHLTTPTARALGFGLVVLGLWVGCAAFEMGNLLGAASGIAILIGSDVSLEWIVLMLALGAGLLLMFELRILIRIFSGLVAGMSLLFLAALFMTPIDWRAALTGLVTPTIPTDSLLTLIALIGTTIVTYNLFLHASAAKLYWSDEPDTGYAWRRELTGMAVFIPLGGLISFAILITGAGLYGTDQAIDNVLGFAGILEPVAGPTARYLFGLGLLGAGLTSAMTAPMAAAAGIRELFGWPEGTRTMRYRAIWLSVLITGLLFGLTGWSPLNAIIAAQAANGILLPVMAGFMLYLAFRQQALRLPLWYKGLGLLVILVCAGLGIRTLWWVWSQF